MAKLSDGTVVTVLNIYRQLLELIDEAKETEYLILERFGETEVTIAALEEL
jgi:ParB-like chromosome segregation protein Spo0J